MWQGVPFEFLISNVPELTEILIRKIPHVVIESSPDYVGAIASSVGALGAGALTAFVAWYAISRNREQMLEQQKILNSQKFIDEIRVKISIFLSDIEKLSIMLGKDNFGHQLTIANVNSTSRAELNEVAHRLDLSYYHILLLIDKKPRFEEVISLIEKMKETIKKSVIDVKYYDLTPLSKKLIDATIKSIDSEWCSVTKSSE